MERQRRDGHRSTSTRHKEQGGSVTVIRRMQLITCLPFARCYHTRHRWKDNSACTTDHAHARHKLYAHTRHDPDPSHHAAPWAWHRPSAHSSCPVPRSHRTFTLYSAQYCVEDYRYKHTTRHCLSARHMTVVTSCVTFATSKAAVGHSITSAYDSFVLLFQSQ